MIVCLIPRKPVCDCSEFNSSLIVRTDLTLFPWQLLDQCVGNSLNRVADVSRTHFKVLIETLAITYRFPLACLHTVFQYVINDEEFLKEEIILG